MSLRVTGIRPDASAAWSETITALAERHRERRAVDVESRWPLAHACTAPRRVSRLASSGTLAVRQAFCCRALA